MNGLTYLLQVNLYLILFLGFYALVLRNETFFKQNRLYLNLSCLFSFIIPFITSEWFQTLFITEKVREVTQVVPIQLIYEPIGVAMAPQADESWSLAKVLSLVYIAGVVIFLVRFFVLLMLVNRQIRFRKGAAFSFFRKIVVDEALPHRKTIVNHEEVHSRQWHSADVILIELAAIVNWFNPAIYLYKKEIKQLHEFIADEEAAASHHNKSDYALLLVSNTLDIPAYHLTNSFFNESLLKRRIIMLSKTRSKKAGLLKYGLCVPLFTGMLIFSSAAVSRPDYFKLPELLEKEMDLSAENSDSQNFESLKLHLSKTIKYPGEAKEKNANGSVLVTFAMADGKISDIKVPDRVKYGFVDQVVSALRSYNSMEPGEGKYSLLVTFSIAGTKTNFKIPKEENIKETKFLGEVAVTAYGTNTVSPPPPPLNERSKDLQTQPEPPSFQMNEVIVPTDKSRPVSNGATEKAEQTPRQDDKILDFASVEVLPKFPGGDQAFGKFLGETIKYPPLAKANNITGRVIATFVVEKDGTLSNIKVLRGLGYGTDEETLRVLKASPKWSPGMSEGKPVRVQYTIPVFFQLGSTPDPTVFKDTNKLLIVDGEITTNEEAAKIDHRKIKEMKVLEPAEAQKQFGEKAKHGAIIITTKKD